MLFEKKEYLKWDEYNEIVSDIEHWCFVSNQLDDHWGDST